MSENPAIVLEEKPSFFQSVRSGISGFIKGIFAGGAVGIATGTIVAAIAALVTSSTVLPALATGATVGMLAFAGIGALSGMTTEVVKSREVGRVNPQDIVNAVNISFAQGVTVGHELTVQNSQDAASKSDRFRKMVEAQRAQQATQETSR